MVPLACAGGSARLGLGRYELAPACVFAGAPVGPPTVYNKWIGSAESVSIGVVFCWCCRLCPNELVQEDQFGRARVASFPLLVPLPRWCPRFGAPGGAR